MTRARGIGSATTIFSVIENVLLDPFPCADVQRIVSIHVHDLARSRRQLHHAAAGRGDWGPADRFGRDRGVGNQFWVTRALSSQLGAVSLHDPLRLAAWLYWRRCGTNREGAAGYVPDTLTSGGAPVIALQLAALPGIINPGSRAEPFPFESQIPPTEQKSH